MIGLQGNIVTNNEWTYEKYKMACKIARVYKIHYTKRIKAAAIITEGCHNWVWKPICRDGSIGIRPRLDMKHYDISF